MWASVILTEDGTEDLLTCPEVQQALHTIGTVQQKKSNKVFCYFDFLPSFFVSPGIVGCDKSQELLPFGPMGESVPAALAISPFVVGAGYVIHRKWISTYWRLIVDLTDELLTTSKSG